MHIKCSNTNYSDQCDFYTVTTFISKEKEMTFWIKLDEIYNCVFEIFSSTKIISSQFTEKTYSVHFQMQVCTHVVISASHENYFGQCLPLKFQM